MTVNKLPNQKLSFTAEDEASWQASFGEPPAQKTFTWLARMNGPTILAVRPDRFSDYWTQSKWNKLYTGQWPEIYPKSHTYSFCGAAKEEDAIKLIEAGWTLINDHRNPGDKTEFRPPGSVWPVPPVTLRSHHMSRDLYAKILQPYLEGKGGILGPLDLNNSDDHRAG
jgi:hypothetical protein